LVPVPDALSLPELDLNLGGEYPVPGLSRHHRMGQIQFQAVFGSYKKEKFYKNLISDNEKEI
jgi:hypothetical protein